MFASKKKIFFLCLHKKNQSTIINFIPDTLLLPFPWKCATTIMTNIITTYSSRWCCEKWNDSLWKSVPLKNWCFHLATQVQSHTYNNISPSFPQEEKPLLEAVCHV